MEREREREPARETERERERDSEQVPINHMGVSQIRGPDTNPKQ